MSEAKLPSEATVFVASAMCAAKDTAPSHRRLILTDVATLLSCHAEDLDFLFMAPVLAANDSDPVAMPDYRSALQDSLKIAVQ